MRKQKWTLEWNLCCLKNISDFFGFAFAFLSEFVKAFSIHFSPYHECALLFANVLLENISSFCMKNKRENCSPICLLFHGSVVSFLHFILVPTLSAIIYKSLQMSDIYFYWISNPLRYVLCLGVAFNRNFAHTNPILVSFITFCLLCFPSSSLYSA